MIRNVNGEPRRVTVTARGALIEIGHAPRAVSRKAHVIALIGGTRNAPRRSTAKRCDPGDPEQPGSTDR